MGVGVGRIWRTSHQLRLKEEGGPKSPFSTRTQAQTVSPSPQARKAFRFLELGPVKWGYD